MSEQSKADLLAEAIADAYLEEEEQSLAPEYTPSRRHKQWVRENVYGKKRPRLYTVGQRIAAVFIVFLLAGACIITVDATRTPGPYFFLKEVGDWFHILFDNGDVQNAPTSIETAYFPTYIPEGYEFDSNNRGHAMLTTIWVNSEGTRLLYDQMTLSVENHIKKEDSVEIAIANQRILYHVGNDRYIYYWCTEEYQFCITLLGKELPLDEIEKIINSISEEAQS